MRLTKSTITYKVVKMFSESTARGLKCKSNLRWELTYGVRLVSLDFIVTGS